MPFQLQVFLLDLPCICASDYGHGFWGRHEPLVLRMRALGFLREQAEFVLCHSVAAIRQGVWLLTLSIVCNKPARVRNTVWHQLYNVLPGSS